jgi:hypothetical protein
MDDGDPHAGHGNTSLPAIDKWNDFGIAARSPRRRNLFSLPKHRCLLTLRSSRTNAQTNQLQSPGFPTESKKQQVFRSHMFSAVPPRCLTRAEAAAYCGLSPAGFSAWVGSGRMPAPILGTRRWDRAAIDASLDRISGLTMATASKPALSPLEKWKASRGTR